MTESTFAPLHGDRGEPSARPIAPAAITIAISREAGARGGSIARRVGKRLGWQVYNQELLEYLCASEAAREPLLMDVPPDATGWIESQLDRVSHDHGIDPRAEGAVMPRLILSIASRGQAILVGRGAGYYLPRESSLHIRVVVRLRSHCPHGGLVRMTNYAAIGAAAYERRRVHARILPPNHGSLRLDWTSTALPAKKPKTRSSLPSTASRTSSKATRTGTTVRGLLRLFAARRDWPCLGSAWQRAPSPSGTRLSRSEVPGLVALGSRPPGRSSWACGG